MKNNYLKILFLSFIYLNIFGSYREPLNKKIAKFWNQINGKINRDVNDEESDAHQRAVLDYLIKAEDNCYNGYRVMIANLGNQGSIEHAHSLCRELREVRVRFVRYYATLHGKSPDEVLQSLNS